MKVVLFPGASLMEITSLEDGVRVRCPGCDKEQDYHDDMSGDFVHEDRCPVHARIKEAVRLYTREANRG